jgi:hypothetical protein
MTSLTATTTDENFANATLQEAKLLLDDTTKLGAEQMALWSAPDAKRLTLPLSQLEELGYLTLQQLGVIKPTTATSTTMTPRQQLERAKATSPLQIFHTLLQVGMSGHVQVPNGWEGFAKAIHAPSVCLFVSRLMIHQLIARLRQMDNGTVLLQAPTSVPFEFCYCSPGNIGCFATRDLFKGEIVLEEDMLVGGCMSKELDTAELRQLLKLSPEDRKELQQLELLNKRLRRGSGSGGGSGGSGGSGGNENVQSTEESTSIQTRMKELFVEAKLHQLSSEKYEAYWNLHDGVHNVMEDASIGSTVKLLGLREGLEEYNGRFGVLVKEGKEDQWDVQVLSGRSGRSGRSGKSGRNGKSGKSGKSGDGGGDGGGTSRSGGSVVTVRSFNIKTCLGIYNTNKFQSGEAEHRHCGVYECFSRFNHACVSNLTKVTAMDGTRKMQAVAKTDIAIGSELTISYGTDRTAIKEEFGFDCQCWFCKKEGF